MAKQDTKKEEKQEDDISTEEVQNKDEQEVEGLKQQVEEAENKYKRALADYQNLQKRVQEERLEWIKSANKELVLRFLPVLDTLLLAYQHIQDEGLKVTIDQFYGVLKAEGIVKIETKDQEFNPETMECIAIDKGEENKVLDEVRAGYLMNEKVLRPAQVKVGKSS